MARHSKNSSNYKRIVTILLLIILICSIVLIIKIKYTENKENKKQIEISQVLDTIDIPKSIITQERTERMLQLEELRKENSDIIGWLEIEGTNINYPVLQAEDNDYYLNHNYKNEKISSGSIFLDKDYNFTKPSENLLIYGHRNKKGLMFEDLIKYKEEKFYKEHSTIRFTTTKEDSTFEIISAFNSKVYYQNETDVFKYYKFVNANNITDYYNYVENCKKMSIYDIEKTAQYGEQLLTLSTCDYIQENGRFVVVAKKIK